MKRRAKVDLFEQIRREYEFGVGTIKGSPVSWEFTAGWCARRWRMHSRPSASAPSAGGRGWDR